MSDRCRSVNEMGLICTLDPKAHTSYHAHWCDHCKHETTWGFNTEEGTRRALILALEDIIHLNEHGDPSGGPQRIAKARTAIRKAWGVE